MTRRERTGILVASVGMFPLALLWIVVPGLDDDLRMSWYVVWVVAQAALLATFFRERWLEIDRQYRERSAAIAQSHAEEIRLLERLRLVVEGIERENAWLRGRVRELEAEMEAERCRN